MQLTNTPRRYGAIAKSLHWLIALAVIGLFALGLWMGTLGYYDRWYQTAPHLHQSIGILVLLAMLLRLAWRWFSPPPAPLPGQPQWQKRAAHAAHWLMYGLILLICASGYLINADSNPVPLFNWIELPSILLGMERQEELMGEIHFYGAWAVIVLAALHTLAALKHHIIDRDETLRRML